MPSVKPLKKKKSKVVTKHPKPSPNSLENHGFMTTRKTIKTDKPSNSSPPVPSASSVVALCPPETVRQLTAAASTKTGVRNNNVRDTVPSPAPSSSAPPPKHNPWQTKRCRGRRSRLNDVFSTNGEGNQFVDAPKEMIPFESRSRKVWSESEQNYILVLRDDEDGSPKQENERDTEDMDMKFPALPSTRPKTQTHPLSPSRTRETHSRKKIKNEYWNRCLFLLITNPHF